MPPPCCAGLPIRHAQVHVTYCPEHLGFTVSVSLWTEAGGPEDLELHQVRLVAYGPFDGGPRVAEIAGEAMRDAVARLGRSVSPGQLPKLPPF